MLKSIGNCYIDIDLINTCPMCGAKISPVFITGDMFYVDDSVEEAIKYSCLLKCMNCKNTFVAQYDFSWQKENGLPVFNQIEYIGPVNPEKRNFDNVILEVSPQFSVIYNQAKAAEVYGLDQIAGCGYRRAFEFLIKDYLCYCNQDLTNEIKKEFLGTCIKNRIDHPKLKQIAERTAWLGNDLTHYEQRYEDKDIEDLKLLIDLSIYWIAYNLLTDKAMEEIHQVTSK